MRIKFIIITIIFSLLPAFASAQVVKFDDESKKKAKGIKVVPTKIEPPMQTMNYQDKTGKIPSEEARKFFTKANRLFEGRHLSNALSLYKKAYKKWDHPRILFNMAVTLVMMGRPLQAANMYKTVLEYGPGPIGPLRYKEAKEKWIELMKTLAIVRIKCTQTGTKVHIDGDLVTTCPANKQVTLNSGRHLLTADKPGYISKNIDIFLPRGVIGEKEIKLKKYESAIRYKKVNRIPLKWTYLGASIAALLLGGGGYAIYNGRQQIDDIQNEVDAKYTVNGNTSIEYDPTRENRAVLYQNIGTAVAGVGVAAAITAVTLFIFKDKTVTVTYAPGEENDKKSTLEK